METVEVKRSIKITIYKHGIDEDEFDNLFGRFFCESLFRAGETAKDTQKEKRFYRNYKYSVEEIRDGIMPINEIQTRS